MEKFFEDESNKPHFGDMIKMMIKEDQMKMEMEETLL